ncbi:hypothetical protein NW767_013743 [Fusarium falciforme]|nr:hypothetical protein NW767_013743 [Fusarium falciforme]
MIFSKVFIAITALAVSGSVNASPCRPSSGASSSTLLSTSTVSASTETTASTSGESSPTPTATATTIESSTLVESTSTGTSTTELSSTTADSPTTSETSSIETSTTTIEITSTTAESSTTAEASSTTAETSTTVQTSSTTAEASSSTTSVCVEPTNFVQNPSFEKGDEPWHFSSGAGRDPSSNSDGNWALSLTLEQANDLQFAEQTISGFTLGLEYKLTYQWWTPYSDTPDGCYFYVDVTGTDQQDDPMPSPNDYFVEGPSFTFTAMSSVLTVRLGVYCTSEPSFSVNLDSIVILPVQPVCSRNVGGD